MSITGPQKVRVEGHAARGEFAEGLFDDMALPTRTDPRLREKGVLVEEISDKDDPVRAAIFRDEDMNPFFLWDDGSKSLEP